MSVRLFIDIPNRAKKLFIQCQPIQPFYQILNILQKENIIEKVNNFHVFYNNIKVYKHLSPYDLEIEKTDIYAITLSEQDKSEQSKNQFTSQIKPTIIRPKPKIINKRVSTETKQQNGPNFIKKQPQQAFQLSQKVSKTQSSQTKLIIQEQNVNAPVQTIQINYRNSKQQLKSITILSSKLPKFNRMTLQQILNSNQTLKDLLKKEYCINNMQNEQQEVSLAISSFDLFSYYGDKEKLKVRIMMQSKK